MTVLPFPAPARPNRGTVHVTTCEAGGFEIGHETASGSSWGYFATFDRAEDAITAAYALNRDQLDGSCDVYVSDAVLQSICPGVGLPSLPGDL